MCDYGLFWKPLIIILLCYLLSNHLPMRTLSPHTSVYSIEKGLKNPPWNLILWWCKLAICLTSCSEIGFGQLRPSEIWQPWHAIFGNPENQIADLQVFELAQQEYGIRFDFQGCHLFENSTISSHMGTLKKTICSKYQKYGKTIIHYPNFVTGL